MNRIDLLIAWMDGDETTLYLVEKVSESEKRLGDGIQQSIYEYGQFRRRNEHSDSSNLSPLLPRGK